MGEQQIRQENDPKALRYFMKHALKDVRALEEMLQIKDFFEANIRRVGAEQELFLVDNKLYKPNPIVLEVLKKINDDHFTTEIAKFNIEANLDPLLFGGDCLSKMESQLQEMMSRLYSVTAECNAEAVMIGILPTLKKSDLELENMTPKPRYFALNDALTKLRGSAYQLQIRGKDELNIRHDTVLLEACNTSFQIHFQVGVDEFAKLYNFAQTITAPVLAAAVNSPILFGRRLWKETRIAVFQQAIDTRAPSHELTNRVPRVSFGDRWIKNSVLEIFKDNIARFRVLIGADEFDEDPFSKIEKGIAPNLKALMLHNGTIYRWNRPCYGIGKDGKPHLRIENRVIPSGPTILDEMANAAFFYGLMSGISEKYDDITEVMDFDDAKANFLAASRLGLESQFTWINNQVVPAQKLICEELIPLAQVGLEKYNIRKEDIDRYLTVIEKRVTSGQTGAQWLLSSQNKMQQNGGTSEQVMAALTSATIKNQKQNVPVHEWSLASLQDAGKWTHNYLSVEQFMTTDLFTVHEDDLIELVANLMDWNHIRHVIVENDEGVLVGLVSYRRILRLFGRQDKVDIYAAPVSSIMQKKIITVSPQTSTLKAIALLRENRISCLPVEKDGRALGIITESDFVNLTGELLEQNLRE